MYSDQEKIWNQFAIGEIVHLCHRIEMTVLSAHDCCSSSNVFRLDKKSII